MVIPGCRQTLHLPVAKLEEALMDMAVVFQAEPGRMAVLFFAKNADGDMLKAGMPLGEPVAPAMFA